MIKIRIGKKSYLYRSKEKAIRSWQVLENIFSGNGLNNLAYFVKTILQRIDNGETMIVYSAETVKPLVSFWTDNTPIVIEWLGHTFQYENTREAFLVIRDLENQITTNDSLNYIFALATIRNAVTEGRKHIIIMQNEDKDNLKYSAWLDGKLEKIGLTGNDF